MFVILFWENIISRTVQKRFARLRWPNIQKNVKIITQFYEKIDYLLFTITGVVRNIITVSLNFLQRF